MSDRRRIWITGLGMITAIGIPEAARLLAAIIPTVVRRKGIRQK